MNFLKKIVTKNPLFFAFFLPAFIDGTVTLLGQSSEYWDSSNRVVNEASPAYYFLLASPWLFLVGSMIWFIIWFWLFLKLPDRFKLFLTLLFIAGHAWGSGSWIAKFFRDQGMFTLENISLTNLSWGILILYFSICAFIASYCISLHFQKIRG